MSSRVWESIILRSRLTCLLEEFFLVLAFDFALCFFFFWNS
jgi:hypothetical protein